MKVIPAIDLMDKKVVRLTKGDPSSFRVYSDDPVSIAKRWEEEGAQLLHIVDLDAALSRGNNRDVIKKIIDNVNIDVEVGGGLRNLDAIEEVLSLGAKRIIIGTAALEEDFLEGIIQKFTSKVAVSIDVIDSSVAIEGWQTKTPINYIELIELSYNLGVRWVIVTDVSRDGTLVGPNEKIISSLPCLEGINYIVSGGIANINDLISIKNLNKKCIWGVILGKSLYENTISLKEVISSLQE